MSDHCGSCSMCCKIPSISEVEFEGKHEDKPEGTWCDHCTPGKGCGIYEDRPKVCSTYECVWLQSHTRREGQGMPLSLRPDKSKVLIQPTIDGKGLVLRTLPENWGAWRKGVVRRWLAAFTAANGPLAIFAITEKRRAALSPAAHELVRVWGEQKEVHEENTFPGA